ncbi:MAG: chemotaxis response regulator protein-glutamate methylesterase, partial [Betaproteobacteria bacterium]|nr:chemotaxis response regulator protein-glutamate methylesterase [Betaproteobacteria bacterium]
PRMDGISFLRQLMAERPTPVVICSTLTEKGAATTMAALSAGAVSFVTKPKLGLKDFLGTAAREIASALKSAAATRPRRSSGGGEPAKAMPPGAPAAPPARALPGAGARPLSNTAAPRGVAGAASGSAAGGEPGGDAAGALAMAKTTHMVIAIGASTGGTQAIESLLTRLPRVIPGIVIVQHMPERFTASLAERLDSLCEVNVREAKTGDRVAPGVALIAPGGKHMTIRRSGAYYEACVMDGPLVNRHRPSVDVLFRSVAQVAGANAIGMIMTGMGDDGARGMREMHDAGARTFAQDEASCVVYGMPKEAVRMGGVDDVIPLDRFPGALVMAARACMA